jgi:hypothetical protein
LKAKSAQEPPCDNLSCVCSHVLSGRSIL